MQSQAKEKAEADKSKAQAKMDAHVTDCAQNKEHLKVLHVRWMFNHTLFLLLPFLARKTEQHSGVSADKVLDKQEDSQSQSQRQKKVTEECSKVDSELRSTKKAVRVPSLSSFCV